MHKRHQFTVKGTAKDPSGIAKVTWSTNAGLSGTASGTTEWSASITLYKGNNTINIRAYDSGNNMAWRSIIVVRK